MRDRPCVSVRTFCLTFDLQIWYPSVSCVLTGGAFVKETQHATKRAKHIVDIPNLVELQLNSYRWFLEEGLQELFESFSPIYDFTGNTSISLIDFTLGEPKYSVEECRDRDMTFESPIKAKVLLKQANKAEIESEVYIGDLPLMTDKGTFIVNGAERVVVSQL